MTGHDPMSYRAILQRVGYLLIAVGVIDIVYMIYCIRNHIDYSSSLNIFAVIAGIFLVRGNLKVTRWVTWFAAFYIAACLGLLLLWPVLFPADLLLMEFRAAPLPMAIAVVVALIFIAILIWTYTQLRSRAVVAARIAAGDSGSPPRHAFILGAGLVVTLIAVLHFALHSGVAAKAVELAQAQVGPGYKFHVESFDWTKEHAKATVKAYNENEIRSVHVEWRP